MTITTQVKTDLVVRFVENKVIVKVLVSFNGALGPWENILALWQHF
jgi:hypothetical protein